jgi:hypothetical protein
MGNEGPILVLLGNKLLFNKTDTEAVSSKAAGPANLQTPQPLIELPKGQREADLRLSENHQPFAGLCETG